MSFLTPLFILGGLAIALPVLFHLSRRATRTRTPFSSLMFLAPTAPRLKRRSRLEHWLLLTLRCLALILLAFGFARPFLSDDSAIVPLAERPRQVVLLLDTSASLQREGLWTDALFKADEVIRSLRPLDHLAVIAFGREARMVLEFSEWDSTPPDARATLARARLASLAPTWEGTRLGEALVTAAEAFDDVDQEGKDGGSREVVLVSDVQAGSRLEALQAYEWPAAVQLRVATARPVRVGNAGVQLLAGAAAADARGGTPIRIRVSNTSDATADQFMLVWKRGANAVGKPVPVYVPPGQSRIVTMEPPRDTDGVDRIELSGDGAAFDNTVFVVPPERQRLRIGYFGVEDAADPTQPFYFLKRALESSSRVQVELVRSQGAEQALASEAGTIEAGFLTAATSISTATALRSWIESGRTLLVAPRSPEDATALALALARVAMAAAEIKPAAGGYAMLGEIDFTHPIFAPFADPRYSDFTKIHFWKYRHLDQAAFANARVLARFDSGDPALMEIPLGRGRILWLASGWQPQDSQLAVSTKFVPLVWSLMDYANVTRPEISQFFVGDALPLPASTKPLTMVSADGRRQTVAPGTGSFSATRLPGIYRVEGDGNEMRFMVNLDPGESRTEALSLDDLEQLGVPAKNVTGVRTGGGGSDAPASRHAVEIEGSQKLWRWFIAATLAVLLTETIIAARARRMSVAAGEGVAP
ncbi:MAG: BatA domain-containing protein [Opitutaceae bacterium]|nr:BatA domain-containing protein [Opitutaceae bacterium]